MMEEKIFRIPAVAGVLEGYVEARLHNDTGPSIQKNVELEKKLADTVATPTYVTIDPKTGQKIRVQQGPSSADTFIEYLRGAALE
jgi:hypothetical protein